MIRYGANLITVGRISGVLMLLSVAPFSTSFFVIYFLCGVSDVADGMFARKTGTSSRSGEILDSTADLLLTAVLLYKVIPVLEWAPWMLYGIGVVAFIRLTALGIGFIKYRTLSSLHTYANKATGFILFAFPFVYRVVGLTAAVIITGGLAGLAALEELVITFRAKTLDRNVTGLGWTNAVLAYKRRRSRRYTA